MEESGAVDRTHWSEHALLSLTLDLPAPFVAWLIRCCACVDRVPSPPSRSCSASPRCATLSAPAVVHLLPPSRMHTRLTLPLAFRASQRKDARPTLQAGTAGEMLQPYEVDVALLKHVRSCLSLESDLVPAGCFADSLAFASVLCLRALAVAI